MERSFKEYIANPLGNKNTVFSSREMYKNMYTNKFNLLMVRENSKIESSFRFCIKKCKWTFSHC